MEKEFIKQWDSVAAAAHDVALSKGWWREQRNDGELIALMHSELSEVLEGLRHGNPASGHLPEFSAVEEELADVIIRVMDYAAGRCFNVAEAVVAKIEFNRGRPHMHGGKKF